MIQWEQRSPKVNYSRRITPSMAVLSQWIKTQPVTLIMFSGKRAIKSSSRQSPNSIRLRKREQKMELQIWWLRRPTASLACRRRTRPRLSSKTSPISSKVWTKTRMVSNKTQMCRYSTFQKAKNLKGTTNSPLRENTRWFKAIKGHRASIQISIFTTKICVLSIKVIRALNQVRCRVCKICPLRPSSIQPKMCQKARIVCHRIWTRQPSKIKRTHSRWFYWTSNCHYQRS